MNKTDDTECLILEHDPDVMVITETWLHKVVPDAHVTPSDYTIVRKDGSTRGGGVALLVRNDIRFSLLDTSGDIEKALSKIRLISRVVYIGGVCRPPRSPDVLESIKTFTDLKLHQDDSIILLGDFNLPGIDWISHSPGVEEIVCGEKQLELAIAFNFIEVLNDYARVSDATFSVLDLTFVSPHLPPFLHDCEICNGVPDHKIAITAFNMRARIPHFKDRKMILNFAAADDVGILDTLEGSFDKLKQLHERTRGPGSISLKRLHYV